MQHLQDVRARTRRGLGQRTDEPSDSPGEGAGAGPQGAAAAGADEIDIEQLPVPDWDLACPHCRYPLRGLPTHRCPECGQELDVGALVRPWTRLREPHFTGSERPLPDFGLSCRRCRRSLQGAAADACPACGEPFNVYARLPRRAWFMVEPWMHPGVAQPLVEMTLEREHIPFVTLDARGFVEVFVGARALAGRVLVASEFFFDLLHAMRQAAVELSRNAISSSHEWRCGGCGETVPGHFEVCWNCQSGRSA